MFMYRTRLLGRIVASGVIAFIVLLSSRAVAQDSLAPGTRVLVDAHNCYPYEGRWNDRIDRALAAGTPIAIEQDLFWYTDPTTGAQRSVVAHAKPLHGDEPSLETYFFQRVRPLVEAELKHPHPETWPIITLNLDIKTEEPEHLHAIWQELALHRSWLTTAVNTADVSTKQPLHAGPILVLAGDSDAVERVFRAEVPVGEALLAFGAIHPASTSADTSPQQLLAGRATNYRRWWNIAWPTVEKGGQAKAGMWTPQLDERIKAMVTQAHGNGLWIRFYTLDGASPDEQTANGWFRTYNFPSLAAAQIRWHALFAAGADYMATDQYQELGEQLRVFKGSVKEQR